MADTPLFYLPQEFSEARQVLLPDDTARHIGQVLRMVPGEEILLTNGLGALASCTLSEVAKKQVAVRMMQVAYTPQPVPGLHLAVSFTKNASRNEWLLEKATELGVQHITPLITARSARERIRPDRWNAILVSAMLQSKQCRLPVIHLPTGLADALKNEAEQKLIAHCMQDDAARMPITEALKRGINAQIFIGPEGDFTDAEVTLAKAAGAIPVALGANRLRTETAALAAITHFYLTNHAV